MMGPTMPGLDTVFCLEFWYQIVSPDNIVLEATTNTSGVLESVTSMSHYINIIIYMWINKLHLNLLIGTEYVHFIVPN